MVIGCSSCKILIADKVNFSKLGQDVWRYLMQGGSVLLSTLSWALLVPILTYFLLVSWPEHVKQWRQLLPKRWRAGFWRVSQEMDEVLSQYMRGQVLLMLSLAVYYAVTPADRPTGGDSGGDFDGFVCDYSVFGL